MEKSERIEDAAADGASDVDKGLVAAWLKMTPFSDDWTIDASFPMKRIF